MFFTTRTRFGAFAAAAATAIGLAVLAPAAAQASALPSQDQNLANTSSATVVENTPVNPAELQAPTGRSGVWANIYNRSSKSSFIVKNRNTGEFVEVGPQQSVAFDSAFTTVNDEIELSVYIHERGYFDIDISNPTIGYPNVTVHGDNEGFSEWEMKHFAVGETRVSVQRHDDKNERKRFYFNITPPGAI